jgi:hypothetical protein
MMPKVNSGDVSWNECAFSVKPGKEEFKMRAVLEWDDNPKDFDIWVRNYDCFDHVAKGTKCDENSNEADCEYQKFRTDNAVRRDASDVCTVMETQRDPPGCAPKKRCLTTLFGEDGKPEVDKEEPNQLTKWLYWGSRYVGDMHKTKTSSRVENWNPDHYMVLETDKKQGQGPETVQFNNVPPGLYQIAAVKFSADKPDSINAGNPRIRISMGGNDIQIKCEIDPKCRYESRVWSVANMKIDYLGPGQGGNETYSIRFIDEESEMKKLRHIEMPTTDEHKCVQWLPPHFIFCGKEYYASACGEEAYSTKYLSNICYGHCELDEGQDQNYKKCLQKYGR